MGKKKHTARRMTLEPLEAPIIDSHCHLAPHVYQHETDQVVARTFAAGIERVINIGAGHGMAGNDEVLRMHAKDARLHPTVGVHPHDAKLVREDPSCLDVLGEMLERPEVVALGEVGLDYHYDFSPRPDQIKALEAQMDMARGGGKPVIIHVREAEEDLLAVLDNARAWDGTVLIHCFSSDWAFARRCLDRGGYIGISGIVTFKKANEVQAVAEKVPDERLLIETDSPYLAPVPFRGKTNEPAFILATVRHLATLRQQDVHALAARTSANARHVFRLTG